MNKQRSDWEQMPSSSLAERTTSIVNTLSYWTTAHEEDAAGVQSDAALWHQRFPGYCHECRSVTS